MPRDPEAGSEDEEDLSVPEDMRQRTSLLQERRIASDRAAGITRIHQQMSQVSSMFRDLSSMVISQGESIATIEQNAERSSENIHQTTKQLKITYDRRQQLKDLLMILCIVALCLLGVSLYSRVRPILPPNNH